MIQQPLIVDDLKNRVAGEVVLPDNPDYENLRNGKYQTGSPAVIARVRNNADIAAAIASARDNDLRLSIRSGGHSQSGMSTNVGGMVIDLSHLNAVEVLDAAGGVVRIGAGAKWGAVAEALSAHGLAISSGDTNSVGVGGLTLGGGIGWLVRKFGLTIDSLLAAEIVTADGRTLRASEREHPDLFWALRGGGGNFGVVSAFEFRAQHITSVFGGMAIYDLAEAESVLTQWSAYMRSAPEELNSTLVLFSGFGPQVPPALMVMLCYGGDDQAAADQAIQPLLELGTLVSKDIEKKPYHHMLEDGPPVGMKAISNNGFVKALDGDVIKALAGHYGRPGTPIVQVRSLGGAMNRVNPDATAFAHRDYEAFVLAATLVPADTATDEANRIRKDIWEPLRAYASGAYVNFLSDASEPSVATAYPSVTYARLSQVKAAYDPDNLFNQNHNIKPA